MAEVKHPNGRSLTVPNDANLDAYKANGWRVVETKKAPAKKKTEPKSEK